MNPDGAKVFPSKEAAEDAARRIQGPHSSLQAKVIPMPITPEPAADRPWRVRDMSENEEKPAGDARTQPEKTEGWSYPDPTSHYIRSGKALCGANYSPMDGVELATSGPPEPTDCKACWTEVAVGDLRRGEQLQDALAPRVKKMQGPAHE
jgi:hypothetical protein